MKRLPLFLIAGAALTGSATLFAQQVTTDAAPGSGAEPFPWPDFIEADPLPGGYRLLVLMESIDIPGMMQGGKDGPAMADFPEGGEIESSYICHTGEVERINILEEIANSSECDAMPLTLDGDNFTIGASCTEPSGEQMRFRATGTANAQGANALVDFSMKEEGMGRMNMTMRVTFERIGECSDIPENERRGDYPEPLDLEESAAIETAE